MQESSATGLVKASASAYLAILCLPVFAAPSVAKRLAAVWLTSGVYSQGILLMLLALHLLVTKRSNGVVGNELALPAALASHVLVAIGMVVSVRSGFESAAFLMIPAYVMTIVWSLGGRRTALNALPALGLMICAMPIWDPISTWLQTIAVVATSSILMLVAMPIHVDGVSISIPEGTFVVEAGCSGVGFFVTSLGVALYVVGTNNTRPLKSLLLLSGFAVLAMLANWARIAALVVIGRATHMQSSLIQDHYWFGWGIFAATLMPAVVFAGRYERPDASLRPSVGAISFPRSKLMASIAVLLCVLVATCLGA